MRALYWVVLLGFGAMAPDLAHAVKTCSEIAKGPNSVNQCRSEIESNDRLRKKWPTVAGLVERPTEELCSASSSAKKINQNRCQEAVDDLKQLIAERKKRSLDRCDEKVEQVKACQACAANLSAAGCQQENIKIAEKFSKKSKEFIQRREQLMAAAKKVEDEMFQLSEDYGENLAQLKDDMYANKKTSPAAAEIGASSISEGLSKHGSASPAEIFRAVDQLRQQSDVSKSDMEEVQSIQNKYARESLTRALQAKAARLEMAQENHKDKDNLKTLDENTGKVSKNTDNLKSVDPAASSKGPGKEDAAGSGGMASGLGGAGGGGGKPGLSSGGANKESAWESGSYKPSGPESNFLANASGNGQGNTNSTTIQDVVDAGAAGGEEGLANVAGSSRSPARESLRERLAAELAQGGKAVGASTGGASRALSPEEKLKRKASADMLAGFSKEELYSSSGMGGSFSMAQSETEAAVKEMMGEFEETFDGNSDFSGGRKLASMADGYSSPEILAADSSDLFLRMRESLGRCQKRGCVTR